MERVRLKIVKIGRDCFEISAFWKSVRVFKSIHIEDNSDKALKSFFDYFIENLKIYKNLYSENILNSFILQDTQEKKRGNIK